MTITVKSNPFVKIPYNDPEFVMTDGFMLCNIAGIDITESCPNSYKLMIMDAMNKGWIVPFAMIKQEMDYCI